jgi:hypothetical protein
MEYEFELAAEIINYVRSDEACQLNYEKLGALLELVIYNEKVVDILKKTPINKIDIDCCFNIAYHKFLNNDKEFKLIKSTFNNLALEWLCLLYH